MSDRTIAAISTPNAVGGISMLRISGPDAFAAADRIFRSAGLPLSARRGHTAVYGEIFDGKETVDDVIATVFHAPKSYTGEDVVELSCHGGLYVTRQVLRAALSAGAVAAEPGEFTKRAFLNGKMDLTKAEAVMSIISAQGEQAKAAALGTLDGLLYRKISGISGELKGLAASLAAWVDYPDEEIEDLPDDKILSVLENAASSLSDLIARFDSGRAVLEGVDTAIVGKPNVGKSTLMNLLTGTEKSIVTEIAGTTRDIVEETAVVGGVVLRLCDTAGLRETDDKVESIGVARAKQKLETATLILAVFDASAPLEKQDKALFPLCKEKHAIAVNKTDLPTKLDTKILDTVFNKVVYISAKENNGLQSLEQAIAEVLGTAAFDSSAATLMNERQLACCSAALDAVNEAHDALSSGVTRDAVQVCVDSAIESLGTLTGERATESVVNEIFSRFCVGK